MRASGLDLFSGYHDVCGRHARRLSGGLAADQVPPPVLAPGPLRSGEPGDVEGGPAYARSGVGWVHDNPVAAPVRNGDGAARGRARRDASGHACVRRVVGSGQLYGPGVSLRATHPHPAYGRLTAPFLGHDGGQRRGGHMRRRRVYVHPRYASAHRVTVQPGRRSTGAAAALVEGPHALKAGPQQGARPAGQIRQPVPLEYGIVTPVGAYRPRI